MRTQAAARAAVEVVTFGCRLNIVESEAIRAVAIAAGHTDLAVVNTCAVTAEAVRQGRQAVRRLARARPDVRIAVTGCAAEIDPGGFAALPGVERVVPNAGKTKPELWGADPGTVAARPAFGADAPGGRTRGFVEIQNGCDHRCTFCVIPFGRGPSRSIAPDRVVAVVRELVAAGAREAVLTGVDVTSYAAAGLGLGGLVKRILAAVPDLPRLRLSSLDCIEADRDLLDCIADEPRFMPHLHLSLQHGSDLILKRMKRRHDRAAAEAFCARVRALRPEIVFGADVIAGFPTEAEAQAAETEGHVEACGITYLHVFPYSARPGTAAGRMPRVPDAAVKARAARLRILGEQTLTRHLDAEVGRVRRVLSERGGRGRTEQFSVFRFAEPPPPGRILDVRVDGHDGRTLLGRMATEA